MLKRALVVIGVVLVLAGCASNGSRIDEQQVKQIVKGETTYEEMVSRFGNPTSQSFTSEGNLQAMWYYIFVGPFGAGMKQQNLTVLFDSDNKVQRYVMSSGLPGEKPE